jgi:hypothetical protein
MSLSRRSHSKWQGNKNIPQSLGSAATNQSFGRNNIPEKFRSTHQGAVTVLAAWLLQNGASTPAHAVQGEYVPGPSVRG